MKKTTFALLAAAFISTGASAQMQHDMPGHSMPGMINTPAAPAPGMSTPPGAPSPAVAAAATAAGTDGLTVEGCWIRSMPQNLPSAGYFVVKNAGAQPATLKSIQTAAFGMAMLHQTQTSGDRSSMSMVSDVPVPAHGQLIFAPNGYHAMLEKPTRALTVGSTVPIAFVFATGLKLTAQCDVRSPSGQSK